MAGAKLPKWGFCDHKTPGQRLADCGKSPFNTSHLEDKVDAGFARIDERFAQQDEKLDEINLKLTALITALNATAEVEAALEGRLLDPNAATTDNPAN